MSIGIFCKNIFIIMIFIYVQLLNNQILNGETSSNSSMYRKKQIVTYFLLKVKKTCLSYLFYNIVCNKRKHNVLLRHRKHLFPLNKITIIIVFVFFLQNIHTPFFFSTSKQPTSSRICLRSHSIVKLTIHSLVICLYFLSIFDLIKISFQFSVWHSNFTKYLFVIYLGQYRHMNYVPIFLNLVM